MDTLDIAPATTPATTAFNDDLEALTAALGDATRRGIYLAVRNTSQPVTVADVAASFDLHPNVARHHLDKLVADGWLEVTHRRRGETTGPGAGRPAKHYCPTKKEVSVQFPQRRYELLAELLVRALESIDPDRAGDAAEQVGLEYGRQLAAELDKGAGIDATISAVAQTMLGIGFETAGNVEARSLTTSGCPFGAAAEGHPEIVCRLDKGIVRGLTADTQEPLTVSVTPRTDRDGVCVTTLD